ncbi:ELL2 factor, partial [Heliornis fulica]|nr:ELL2 factor [Heliornis fulica]
IPKDGVPNEVQTFNFCMSDVDKNKPQESVECVQEPRLSSGVLQLNCLAPVQNKITIYGTGDNPVKTPAQAEEELRSPSAKVIKPSRPLLGKRPAVRKTPQVNKDPVPERKRSTPMNPAWVIRKKSNIICQQPYRDRVIHLLALRSYKKPELLIRLQRDGVNRKDKNSLGPILNQVRSRGVVCVGVPLSADFIFKEIRKDWPGYSEIDKQSLELILSRKLNPSQNATSTSQVKSPETFNCDDLKFLLLQKCPLDSHYIYPVRRKIRISRIASRDGALMKRGSSSAFLKKASATTPPRPSAATTTPKPLWPALLSTSRPLQSANPSSGSIPEKQETQDLPVHCSSQKNWSLIWNQQQKCTSTVPYGTHVPTAEGAPECSEKQQKDDLKEKETASLEMSPGLKPDEGFKESCTASTNYSLSSEEPDYTIRYVDIVSCEQRESYKSDFDAEYGEYRHLHAQVESVTQRFLKLDAQRKLLSSGTKEYEMLQSEILEEYRKVQESTPSYYEVKRRCEYLHNKLSHIKRLVA